MKKIIIGVIVAVAVVIPLHVSLVSASESFFGADSAYNNPADSANAQHNSFFGPESAFHNSNSLGVIDQSALQNLAGSGSALSNPYAPHIVGPTGSFFGSKSTYKNPSSNDRHVVGPCEYGCDGYYGDSCETTGGCNSDSYCDWDCAYDPCDDAPCYPRHDDTAYQNPSTNTNTNDNSNTNINQNEIYINIYGNGSVTGTGINARSLPSCNNALDDDEDGRIDFNDSDCLAFGRENGKNVRLNATISAFPRTDSTGVQEEVIQPTRSTEVSQSEGRVAGASFVATAEASEKSNLRAYNIRIDTDEFGNSVVSWDTTKPTRGRVMFGRASQGDRSGTDFTGAGQYEFATPNTPETSTSHRVILGQLEAERVYYFRVVSFAGTDIIASSERSFVQLGNGETLSNGAGFASVIGTLGSFVFSSWFLFLMIIIIVLIIVFRRRNQQEILAHAPVEMHVGGGHH